MSDNNLKRRDPGSNNWVRGTGRSMLQGALAGFGDEATAAVAAALAATRGDDFSKAYEDILKNERSDISDFSQTHPWTNFGGEFVGSLAPAGAVFKGAKALGDPLSAKIKAVRASIKAAQNPVAQATVTGAVAGAGAADNDSRALGAVTGGGLSAGIATGLGALGKGLHGIGRMMGLTNVDKDTAAAILAAMKKDGLDPREVLPQVAELVRTTQRPVALADFVAGKKAPNTQRLIDEALGRSGGHRQKVADHLEGRLLDQKDRVLNDVADSMNRLPQAVRDTVKDIVEKRSSDASPFYEAAFKNETALKDPRLWEILGTPAGKSALAEARALAANNRDQLTTRFATKDELADIPEHLFTGVTAGNGRIEYTAPSLKTFDYIKRKLWDQAQALKRGGQKEEAAAVDKLRRDMVKVLDEIGPDEYKLARSTHAQGSELIDAAELGAELFKKPVSEIRERVAKMTDGEREALLAGFAGHVHDLPFKTNQDFAKAFLVDTSKMERLKEIMPSPEAYERFIERLRVESMMTTGAKAYPGASMPSTSALNDAIAAARMAKGDVRGGILDVARSRLGMGMPEGEAERVTEFAFGRPLADEFQNISRGILTPPGATPLRPAAGASGALSILGGRDPGFEERLQSDLEQLR